MVGIRHERRVGLLLPSRIGEFAKLGEGLIRIVAGPQFRERGVVLGVVSLLAFMLELAMGKPPADTMLLRLEGRPLWIDDYGVVRRSAPTRRFGRWRTGWWPLLDPGRCCGGGWSAARTAEVRVICELLAASFAEHASA
jgi:hypothetical protein